MEWNKLKTREKRVLYLLGACLFFWIYMKFIDQPVSRQVASYKSQIKRSEVQLRDLETKQPQDVELSMKIKDIEAEDQKLTDELDEMEKMVPSRLYTSQLVGELTRLAKEVKLESVKQRITKEQTFSRIFLEVKFYSSYIDAMKYLAAVESISPFVRVEELEILEPVGKTIELGGAPVKLLVSCLLTDSANPSVLKASDVPELNLKRDILVSASKPAETLADDKYVLEGVTFDPRNPTAIINGDVFRVNEALGGYKVKKILADSVVLSDGVEDHLLSLKAVEKPK